ncbi:MAG TPA: efflux RND transporter periplasmic adaptor subunit [Steroidobacteraceae bacterium]|nr:efflux RND transporter periplasmic adaptor subunit [Steroidobacteraceae bacterium]
MRRLNIVRGLRIAALCAVLCADLSACGGHAAETPSSSVPKVAVVVLKAQPVTLTRNLPGRTSAYLIAEVRPQVSGIVKRRKFVEGGNVVAGQVLYDLDDSLYLAEYESAKAGLQRAQAVVNAARLAAARSAELVRIDAVSAQDNESAIAALGQAEAEVAAAKAAVDSSAVNLAYAHIVAPISGRIGKSSVTQGALVTAGQAAALATIQQLDPIYVEVNQSSSEWLGLKQDIDAGRVQTDRSGAPAKILLENGEPYAHPGKLQFADVTVDSTTGNFLLRAIVPNPNALLLPGMYVRAVLNEGVRAQGLLAPQVGITRDPKGVASALIVDKNGKVEVRSVRVSRTIGDQWLIEEGLSAGDRLIVEGLQKVQPGMAVQAVEQAAAADATAENR